MAPVPASPQSGGAGRTCLWSRCPAERDAGAAAVPGGRGSAGLRREGVRPRGIPGAGARRHRSPRPPPLPVSRARQNGGKVRHKRQALQDMARPLKQWLYKHRDNPYPTKTEKILLALGSQMTLVQVTAADAPARVVCARIYTWRLRLGKDGAGAGRSWCSRSRLRGC